MECILFAARYQPEDRTLEFDLTDAPLVDVVTDVTVAPCGLCVPLWKPPTMQQGLFYGHNTFVLDHPLVFADDYIAILCCLRVRQQRMSTLAALASSVLRGDADGSAVHRIDSQNTREYLLLLTEVSGTGSYRGQDDAFVYLTSQALLPLMEGASTTMTSSLPPPPPLPRTHLAYAPERSPPCSLLALSAHALCYL
ncbi:hypothetical protein LSCM1_01324 [Leishmania martiniquensis]|uniref:Uncharacterized protein n=1 Tax=Leishmania martiniquensis TaxID=1580590 RepID=A0A836H5E1_9TRYP|nr:hypothetical protein LSCM1_01324 [Leishmania martiniquensis]